jgi:hypothetical protein
MVIVSMATAKLIVIVNKKIVLIKCNRNLLSVNMKYEYSKKRARKEKNN